MFCVPVYFAIFMYTEGEVFMEDTSMEGEIQMAKQMLDSARRSLLTRRGHMGGADLTKERMGGGKERSHLWTSN